MNCLLSSSESIVSTNRQVIHDVSFDHFGQRLATCSNDQLIKVWDKQIGNGSFKLISEWKAHNGQISKVNWARPEFGQVLVSCSVEGTVAIWEKLCDNIINHLHEWVRRTVLVDSKTAIVDAKFSPNSLGLLLATCSKDGSVRIYKVTDPLNLAKWTLQQEVNLRFQATCISWNPSFNKSHINGSELIRTNEFDKDNVDNVYSKYPHVVEEVGSFFVSFQEPMIAIGFNDMNCSSNETIVILQYNNRLRRWYKSKYTFKGNASSSPHQVNDLSFSARMGRSYDLLAVASKDIRIYAYYLLLTSSYTYIHKLYLMANFEVRYDGSFWKLSWNLLGNVLITVGDDRCIRVWKQCHVISIENEKKQPFPKMKSCFTSHHLNKKCSWKPMISININ